MNVAALLAGVFLLSGCELFVPAAKPAPLAPGTRDCIGVTAGQCEALLENARRGRPIAPVAWRVRCTSAVCGRERGDAEITVTWSNGETEMSAMGWVGDLAGPEASG